MRLFPRTLLRSACLIAIAAAVVIAPRADARRGDLPLSATRTVEALETIDVLSIAPPDVEALRAEDELARAEGSKIFRYAAPIEVRVTPSSHGTWQNLDGGGRLWRLVVEGSGATDLNLGFTRYRMPEGGTLHVSSLTEDYFEGPYTAADNEVHGELWVPVVPGSRAVLEVFIPAKLEFEPELELTHVGYGYANLFAAVDSGWLQGSCNNDVVCPEAAPWLAEVQSVAGYSTGGSIFCTGQMIMDVPNSFRNFFITAYHCGISAGNAPSLVVFWNFHSPNCGDLCCGSLSDNQTGSIFRARRQDVDMCLVELDDVPDPASNVYYAGWDATGAVPQGSVGIHHPNGDEKAISFNIDPLATVNNCIGGGSLTHWRVNNWEDGTTEPGSSGSGIWDPDTHLLVGFLSGGTASCSSITSDCYGKFSVAWDGASASTRLRDWLDPNNTGTLTVPGSFPDGSGVLVFSSFSSTDQCATAPGNENGIWEPGETVEIVVELTAVGADLTGIQGTLTTSTAGVTIVDGSATWPDINSGQTASTNSPHFTIALSQAIACETIVELSLEVSANDSGPFTINFSDKIGRGVEPLDLPLGIPDNVPAGTTSTITVDQNVALTDVNVRVEITHTWVGDLKLQLRSPAGTLLTLMDRPGVPASQFGCQDDNMNVTFDDSGTLSAAALEARCTGATPWYDGSAVPLNLLVALNGQSSVGDWDLIVSDNAGADTGTIIFWELITTPALEGQCEECPTSAAVEPADSPSTLGMKLSQNTPNPFNPYTTIAISLDQNGPTTLAVFDVGGRLIQTLLDESMTAGVHEVTWDGTDAAGRPVATGVYFYRLEQGDRSEVRRMSLVR